MKLPAFRSNLSLKLVAYFVLAALFLSLAIGGFMRFGFERNFADQIRPHFRQYFQQINRDIGVPPNLMVAKAISAERPLTIRIFGHGVRWASDDVLRRPARTHRHDSVDFKKHEHDAPRHIRRFFRDSGKLFILHKRQGYDFYYGFSLKGDGIAWFPWMAAALVLLTFLGIYYFIRRLFLPVKEIQQGVRLIGQGQVGHQITIQRSDELGQLAKDVNKMSQDLGKMLQAKRDLLLALSHELRSPLARSRVSIALLEPSVQKQALLKDQQHIEQLIAQILASERGQEAHGQASKDGKNLSRHSYIQRSPTDMRALVNALMQDEFSEADIALEFQGELSAISVDANQIRRLLRNLLNNAQRYNRADVGKVSLSLQADKDALLIEVADHGEGIEAAHIERLTEPFYQVDAARTPQVLVDSHTDLSRSGELDIESGTGLGLGLYLCQVIVDAHQGKMQINSQFGSGTQVKVRI